MRRPLLIAGLAAMLSDCAARKETGSPLVVQVHQAQGVPAFSHVILKLYRDQGGRPGSFVRSTACVPVAQLAPARQGRRRLDLPAEPGGPYFLQFTGHTESGCSPTSAVAAAMASGISAAAGTDTVVPVFAAPVEGFAVVTPPPLGGSEVVPRAFHTATLGAGGALFLAGGAQEATVFGSAACARGLTRCLRLARATSGVHRLDPGSGATVLVGALADRRFLHSATALADGRVAFAGGAQAATIGGAGSGNAPLVRAEPVCTNPNEAAGPGCILRSLEIHALSGTPPVVAEIGTARAAHAALRLDRNTLLVAGGRESTVQLGCASDAHCAAGAVCDALGRCLDGGRDCAQVGSTADVCLPGYVCEQMGPDAGKCIKRGCTSAEDCGGCLASGGCGGVESTCDVVTGLCTRRGCGTDSECLGSNRRCLAGACVQVGCDSLSGCRPGSTCDVRTGKCKPDGVSLDCAEGGNCNCAGDADCASGFTCQTSGDFAGRCRSTQTGCPATACRRDTSDPAQGPYFDPVTGQLRRNVNCEGGQCVLSGCLGDVDCPLGSLCMEKKCVNGRRVTAPTNSVEICNVAGTPARNPCTPAAQMMAAREGLSAACLSRDGGGACTSAVLWGGNFDPAHAAELRDGTGAPAGEISLPGCGAAGACTPAFSALAEGESGVVAIGGAALGTSGAQYRFLATGYIILAGAPASAEPLASELPGPRVFAASAVIPEGVVLLGGAGENLGALATGGLFTPVGPNYQYSEPEQLRLATARFGHTVSVLPDGRIVVVGGVDADGAVLSSVEIFVPRSALR